MLNNKKIIVITSQFLSIYLQMPFYACGVVYLVKDTPAVLLLSCWPSSADDEVILLTTLLQFHWPFSAGD